MTEEQFDRFVNRTAKGWREPPPTPREEIWQRIQAARTGRRPAGDVVDLASRRRPLRPWYLTGAALAAAVVLGIAIGRRTVETVRPGAPAAVAAAPDSAGERRAETVLRFAAVEHLSRVEALLTDFERGTEDAEVQDAARDLLSRTRLLLDSRRMVDPRLRALLLDLELILAQIAQAAPDGGAAERELIDDGINERHVRFRLRNAIPAGPTA
jgi:hypothetical protein